MHKHVDNVLEMLKDGKWHSIREISQKSKLHECKIELLANFLSAFSFLELNTQQEKARLSKTFTEFLEKSNTETT